MPLHPQAAAFLSLYYGTNPESRDALPPHITREQLINQTIIPPDCPVPAKTEDRMITGRSGPFRIRIHTPHAPAVSRDAEALRSGALRPEDSASRLTGNQTALGGCLYFHGGGWVLGSIETHDDIVRRLVDLSGRVFVSVDYPLAPEHKYPIPVEDSYFALNWVFEHAAELNVDPNRITVAGDSAGANIAAVLCHLARDRRGPKIERQVLTYPITDCNFERVSYQENAKGYFLCLRDMKWFWKNYVERPEQMAEPMASPLKFPSHADLPPALVLTAEYDPLRDEGVDYAKALQQAGVPATLREFPGMIHGFLKRWDAFDDARTAMREIGEWLKVESPESRVPSPEPAKRV